MPKSTKKQSKSVESKKKPVKTTSKRISPKSRTTHEIVKEHLRNKNHKITEDDLKNVKLDLGLPHDKAHAPLPIKNKNDRPKDIGKDHEIITPWDVIDE